MDGALRPPPRLLAFGPYGGAVEAHVAQAAIVELRQLVTVARAGAPFGDQVERAADEIPGGWKRLCGGGAERCTGQDVDRGGHDVPFDRLRPAGHASGVSVVDARGPVCVARRDATWRASRVAT